MENNETLLEQIASLTAERDALKADLQIYISKVEKVQNTLERLRAIMSNIITTMENTELFWRSRAEKAESEVEKLRQMLTMMTGIEPETVSNPRAHLITIVSMARTELEKVGENI